MCIALVWLLQNKLFVIQSVTMVESFQIAKTVGAILVQSYVVPLLTACLVMIVQESVSKEQTGNIAPV